MRLNDVMSNYSKYQLDLKITGRPTFIARGADELCLYNALIFFSLNLNTNTQLIYSVYDFLNAGVYCENIC